MNRSASLVLISVCFIASGCSTHIVALKYEPTLAVSPVTGSPQIASATVSDNRGIDSTWLGAIRGGYGNPLKKLRTDRAMNESVTAVLVDALRSRQMLGGTDRANKAIEASITKLDCSYYVNREAHAHLNVTVLSLPERAPVFSKSYKTDNVEQGVGAGIFGSVKHLAGFAQKTLNETIDKILADPAFLAALSAKATPSQAPRSVADRLRQLEQLHQQGLLNDQEYDAKRKELIDGL